MSKNRRRALEIVLVAIAIGIAIVIIFWLINRARTRVAAPAPDAGVASRNTPPRISNVLDVKDIAFPDVLDEKTLVARIETPVLSRRKTLVENVRSETLAETVTNLGNFDDKLLAETSLSGALVTSTSGQAQTRIVTRLLRVRKLLEEGRRGNHEVARLLKNSLTVANREWPRAFREKMDAYEAADRAGKAFTRSEANECDRLHASSLAATYILAELGETAALPLLVQSHHLGDNGPKSLPCVPPAITLYATHSLIVSYPEQNASLEARKARKRYLDLAEDAFPTPDKIKVTAPEANYSESDPRFQTMHPDRRALKGEPTMTMAVYPYCFSDGTIIAGTDGEISERAKRLFDAMEEFVRLAYP